MICLKGSFNTVGPNGKKYAPILVGVKSAEIECHKLYTQVVLMADLAEPWCVTRVFDPVPMRSPISSLHQNVFRHPFIEERVLDTRTAMSCCCKVVWLPWPGETYPRLEIDHGLGVYWSHDI